jgi:hypothetical protein
VRIYEQISLFWNYQPLFIFLAVDIGKQLVVGSLF